MPGALKSVQPATMEVQKMCHQVKHQVEEKHGRKYPVFVATDYKMQLVAGTNYFIKVRVGDGQYIHLRLFQTLPHAGQTLSLTAAQTGEELLRRLGVYGYNVQLRRRGVYGYIACSSGHIRM